MKIESAPCLSFCDIVKKYIVHNLQNIPKTEGLYFQKEGRSNLHFFIVLDNDTLEIRNDYYDFLDKFRESKLSLKFFVLFHFLDDEQIKDLSRDTENIPL